MRLQEIILGDTKESKRDVVQKYSGQRVILKDLHHNWCHGVLLKEEGDDEIYCVNVEDTKEKRKLHYHDLNQLLVISKD